MENDASANAPPDHPDGKVTDGPYLAVAAICDQILVEASGTISIIRVVDRVVVARNDDLPANIFPFEGTLIVGFRGGRAGADENGLCVVAPHPVANSSGLLNDSPMVALPVVPISQRGSQSSSRRSACTSLT